MFVCVESIVCCVCLYRRHHVSVESILCVSLPYVSICLVCVRLNM